MVRRNVLLRDSVARRPYDSSSHQGKGTDMSVGEAIQSVRRARGLTQEQLAAKVYVTRQAVSRWETGESEPGIDMRKLLAST